MFTIQNQPRYMLEEYFKKFQDNIIGNQQTIETPFGTKRIIYADWTASGRNYKKIEKQFINDILPFVANTHTETTTTGKAMTQAYHYAKETIKEHVNAGKHDSLIFEGTGMTGVVNKLQRILGFKYPEKPNLYMSGCSSLAEDDPKRPVVFITHMEHHSNQTSWLETIAQVEIIEPTEEGLVDLEDFQNKLEKHKNKTLKIASVTACSNVTGIQTPYHKIAEMIHKVDGYCFVDFACSGPYVKIDMHPENEMQKLDAIFLSPHKFLGGPGTPGVMVFCNQIYHKNIPDNPGGGTVTYTNPWGERHYISDIETREDGGTPGFLQSIKTAMAVRLKDEMGTENIAKREKEIIKYVFERFEKIKDTNLLASNIKDRLGVFSFTINNMHYNLMVKLLNDRFGIQTRGGCACAGTYGHYLLDMDSNLSHSIFDSINEGDNTNKPGWIRMSIHPTMRNSEIKFIMDSIEEIIHNLDDWKLDYQYNSKINDFIYIGQNKFKEINYKAWF